MDKEFSSVIGEKKGNMNKDQISIRSHYLEAPSIKVRYF